MSPLPSSDQEIWNILMQLAEPSALLKSLLTRECDIPAGSAAMAVRSQKIVITHCTVTINQTVAPPPEADLSPAS